MPPTAILRSPTGHEVEVWVSEYPYPHPPLLKGGVQLLLLKIGKNTKFGLFMFFAFLWKFNIIPTKSVVF